MNEIESLLDLKNRLLIFNNIREKHIFQVFEDLLYTLKEVKTDKSIIDSYYKFSSEIIEYGESTGIIDNINPWQAFILNFLLEDENIFTHQIENNSYINLGLSLKNAVKNDLSVLENFYRIDCEKLKIWVENSLKTSRVKLPEWNKVTRNKSKWNYRKNKFIKFMNNNVDWKKYIENLAEFYQKNGTGILNSFKVFKWNNGLKGLVNVDDITFSNLIGYENQIKQVKKNTEKLLNKNRANNILLYGEKGTGKSSTVKAVVNEYWHKGLRLIELEKDDFSGFNEIINRLNNSSLCFILFIDDLSFSEKEHGYRELKAILEGRTQLLPENVVIYATSNRRHLVKENFSNGENNIRKQDSIQEKLSLADRFGITLIYTAPTQKEYIKIVKALADQRDLPINTEDLIDRAKKWEKKQNGRSGRTARQFIDYIEGELNMENGIY
ncbi:MAG: ATP-binding protein [bacterium]